MLHWIRNQSREFKPFVANRVGEIHRSSNPQQWRHIPGDMNPADLPTRGLSATELANSKVWAEGPSIILCEESTWPPQLPNEQEKESTSNDERRKVTHVTIETPGNNPIDPITDSFINAFSRMVARRGTPKYVLSDNGTNFVGAERELRELVEALDQKKIASKTTREYDIEWKINPPSAPHFGGVFEAMIKSAKKSMRAILGNADVTDEELQTAICGAERLLNSRPITFVSADPEDVSPLTPSHFLTGELGGKFAPEAADQEEIFNPRKRWHRVQQLLGQFWKRWRREFLPSLNIRKKWFHPNHNLKKDDVVVVVDKEAKRAECPLGRVVEAFPGVDGLVRVVKIKTKDGEYVRPIHCLCPLEYAE